MKTFLFNPFRYFAGIKSLLLGACIMAITACISYYSKTHFDGVIDAHTGLATTHAYYFFEVLTDWSCAILFFYPGTLIFSKSSVRFIDIAGTLALARWPMLFVAIVSFLLPPVHGITDINAIFIIISIVNLSLIVLMITLMYNAFSVSGNMKGGKAIAIFISCLLLAEILSKVISHRLFLHFGK